MEYFEYFLCGLGIVSAGFQLWLIYQLGVMFLGVADIFNQTWWKK